MYKVVKSEHSHIGRFEVVLDSIEKDGEIHPYSYIKFTDAVCVIPLVEDEKLLIINEYRHAIKQWVYSFPSGMLEKNEHPDEAVKRELLEETGYEIVELKSLGCFYPSYGSTTEKIYLYAASVEKNTEAKRDALELVEVEEISIVEFEELLKKGKFVQGAGMAAWLKWKLMNN